MNEASWLSDSWMHRLGWTLIQFLWQGTVLAVIYALVRATLGRLLSSRGRYALACGTLLSMTMAPPATFLSGAGLVHDSQARWLLPVEPDLTPAMPVVVGAWLVGVVGFSARLLGGWIVTRRLRTVGVQAAPLEWQRAFERLAHRLDVSRKVRLLVSALVDAPVVIGWMRPVVLVPAAALTGFPPEYVQALLAHELAHVCRRDYLVNLLQRIAEAVLFYHPGVWWVSDQIRTEREMCCDDIAVECAGDPVIYARALAQLDAGRLRSPLTAVAANGPSLLDRVGRLLGQTTSASRLVPAPGSLAGIVVLWFVGFAAVSAQTMRQPDARLLLEAAPLPRADVLTTTMFGPVGPVGVAASQSPSSVVSSGQGGQAGAVAPPAPPVPLDRFATGTGVIRGRVLRLDTGAPLRRARVTLRRSGLAEPPAGVTDDEGRYELTGLPAGRFTVVALKDGFISAEFGQDPAAPSGRPIELSDGQLFERADVSLSPGGVLSGQVVDENGEPQGGVIVRAMRQQFVDGLAVPGPAVGIADQTDDLGQFRLFGLAAGDYFVGAVPGDPGLSDMMRTSVISFENSSKTFYPGTIRPREARPIRVNAGQEVGGLVFSASPRRAFRISGTVTSTTARPDGNLTLTITQESMSGGRSFSSLALKPDGAFTTGELAPGEYMLVATASSDKTLTARTRVVLENADATAHLVLKRGDTLRGRVVFDAGSSKELLQPSSVRLVLDGPASSFQMFFSGIRIEDDWSFEAGGLGGAQRLQARLPQGWALKSVRHAGRDVTDEPFEFEGADIQGVEVTLTQRVTTVAGSVSDSRNQPSLEATVIVLADDPSKWMPGGRYVKRARLDDQGRFVIQGLPPGQYVATAVTTLAAGAEADPAMLSRLRKAGERLTLNDGESRNLALRVVTP